MIVSKLKTKKSGDRSGWNNEMIKWGGKEMIKSLTNIFNIVLKTQKIPREWGKMTIMVIHKKKSRLKIENKRGLFLTNVISKVLEKILKERNKESTRKGISQMQNGGMEGRSTIDNLMMVISVIERNMYLKKDTYVTFIDMVKCFDKLWLHDGIKEIWKCGTNIKDAIIVKKNE